MPSVTDSLSDLLVAAITRTSTWIGCVPPTRKKLRSSSTRSSLTCVAAGISPTSSRKIVPSFASSKRPRRRSAAPVKAPFSWPNSSLSSSVSGIAAQFTAMNALPRPPRGERSWIARGGEETLRGRLVQAAGENDGRRLPASHRLAHIVERGDHGSIETRLLERGVDADGVLEIVGGDQNSVSHLRAWENRSSCVVRRAWCSCPISSPRHARETDSTLPILHSRHLLSLGD